MSEGPVILEPIEDEVDNSKAPLLEHLLELRSRLIKCVLSLVVGCILCIPFLPQILAFLLSPFRTAVDKYNVEQIAAGREPLMTELIATQILETFFVNIWRYYFGLSCHYVSGLSFCRAGAL